MGRKGPLFVLGILVLLVAACGPLATPAPAPTTLAPITLRMVLSGEPDAYPGVIVPQVLKYPADLSVLEPLVGLDRDGKPVPALATKWEQLNPTTWRIYLRRGVKFHNGADFAARDVLETVKWVIDEKGKSFAYSAVPVKEAVAVDDYTVDLSFEKPRPLFLLQQAEFLIYAASEARDNRDKAGAAPIGTGPYRFVSWERGASIKLAKYDDYWGPKPQIDRVVITWRGEPAVRLAALRAGEVDWAMELTPEDAKNAPKTVSVHMQDRYVFKLDVSVTKNPILADKRLRLAIDYAINRENLVRLFAGSADILQGQLALPGEFGYDSNLKARPYDLDKARALVQEAGAVGKTLSMVGSSGKRLKDREVTEQAAFMIEKTGLKVKLAIVQPSELGDYVSVGLGAAAGRQVGSERKTADIVLQTPDFAVQSESRFGQTFYRDSIQLTYEDEKAWKLYDQALAETDLNRRSEKLAQAWAYIYEQAYYIPLVVPATAHGLAATLEWVPNLMGVPLPADMRFTR